MQCKRGLGGRDLVYNSRPCIVCSLLVGCVFPSGVIGVQGWPGCHNGLLLWPCGHSELNEVAAAERPKHVVDTLLYIQI